MLVYISELHTLRSFHVAMTLCKFSLVSSSVCRDVGQLVSLVHLFENEVVSTVVLADDGQQAAVLVVADMQVTDG